MFRVSINKGPTIFFKKTPILKNESIDYSEISYAQDSVSVFTLIFYCEQVGKGKKDGRPGTLGFPLSLVRAEDGQRETPNPLNRKSD